MGRRKIEIKAIKDDRNRSVTFLKRKGGLFKKAHELSVLCSVDVAVIIFGANKKLYEFSSGDIHEIIGRHQYYGGAHEHKGPSDFQGKRDGDGSDDEEVDEHAIEDQMRQGDQQQSQPPPHQQHPQQQPPPPPHMLPHMQAQAGYNHMRPQPSDSPPVGNGVMGYHPRQHTPQPGVGSRPSSRNAGMIRRPGSNLGHPPQHAPQVPNGYTSYLQQQGPFQAPPPPSQQAPQHHPPPQQGPPPPPSAQHPPYPYSQPPTQSAPHAQMHHPQYLEERRMSVPTPYRPPPNEPHRQSTPQPPQQPPPPQVHAPQAPPASSTPPQQAEPRQDLLQVQQPQPKPLSVKSKSIFTPIDDNRSMLAGQWGMASNERDLTPIKQEKPPLSELSRPSTVDMGSVHGPSAPPKPPQRTFTQPQRTQSTASLSGEKRPNLKLTIPTEAEGEGDGTTASPSAIQSSPKPPATGAAVSTNSGETGASKLGVNDSSLSAAGASGVVLPPPSPSASAILSAGVQGPPNPFARPLPPGAAGAQNSQAYGANSNIETPMSALPSRFVADQFLPSPSSFYPEWGFGRSAGPEGSNMLPSPLNFQTPIGQTAPGFGERSESSDANLKREREGGDDGDVKRVKT